MAKPFWRPSKVSPTSQADEDAPPAGLTGDIRPNGSSLASFANRKAIIAAIAVGGVLFLAIEEYQHYKQGEAAVAVHVIHPVKAAPTMTYTPPPKPPVAPSKKHATTAGATPSGSGHTAGPSVGQTPAAARKPAYSYAPQMSAVQAALGGSGSASGQREWKAGAVSSSPGSPTSGAGAVQAAKKTSSGVYDQHLVRKETSPYELLTGSVIPAILTTGINSNLPGEITAVVNQPVYNTVNGAYVLIPAGSKLVGTYANKIIANQDRLAVGWQRVLFPNGTYINLGAMPGASAAGYSGFHDLTDDHTWTMVKGALLMSLVDVGTAIASPVSSYSGGGNMALSSGEQGLAQSLGTAEANLLQKDMSIAPTLKIRQGYTFEVVVTKDMIFPGPYKSTIQTQSNTAKNQVAPATMLNPYNK